MAASSSTWCAERTVGGGPVNPPPFSFRKLVQRIREEFDDFPDLRLSASEAASFWALDLATCQRVLRELLATGFLARESGRYLKRSA
jgi:Fic family protein